MKLRSIVEIKNELNISRAIYIWRAFGIFSVAFAHCTYSNLEQQRIAALFGTIGVPIFLMASGYYYNNNLNFLALCYKKIKSIIIPWIFWGGITYGINVITGNSICSFSGYFQWLLGYGTWLYYVPVILCCYICFYRVRNFHTVCIIAGISAIANIFTLCGISDMIRIITNYQNPLNWFLFFLIGMVIKRYCGNKILLCGWIKWGLFALTGIIGCFYCNKVFPSYWSLYSIPFELLAATCLLQIALKFPFKMEDALLNIGKQTYILYFTHMQIGIVILNKLFYTLKVSNFSGIVGIIIFLIRPVGVIYITFAIVWICKRFLRKFKLFKLAKLAGIDIDE